MPSWDLFEKQPQSYRGRSAAAQCDGASGGRGRGAFGWGRYVGPTAQCTESIASVSAPYKVIAEELRLHREHIVERAHEAVGR